MSANVRTSPPSRLYPISTEVCTTFFASSNGPGVTRQIVSSGKQRNCNDLANQYDWPAAQGNRLRGLHAHAIGTEASPDIMPDDTEHRTVETVGSLPGALYTSKAFSPVNGSMTSAQKLFRCPCTVKLIARTNVTLTKGAAKPVYRMRRIRSATQAPDTYSKCLCMFAQIPHSEYVRHVWHKDRMGSL